MAADIERIMIGWGILQSRMYDCPPQSRAYHGAMHIYVGTGDWRTVQQLWRRLIDCSVQEDQQPAAPAAPLSVRIEPALVIAADATAQVTLLVKHLRARRVDGRVHLELPSGWQTNVTELAFNAVNWQHPDHSTVCFTTTAQPGAYTGRLALRSAELDADIDLPLIRLGDDRSIGVRETAHGEQPILTIDNGPIEIDVTPGFAGTVSAIRESSVNHLRSPFPKVTTLGWLSPWYGGLMPVLTLPDTYNFPSILGKATFCSELIDCEDSQGIVWQGVRQRATLSDPALRDLTLELDTLTVGGSPVVKLVLRLINATSVTRRLGKTG
ncbi:MAG: hypothetical protein MI924_27000 [Chloroflexales bacterium]|nr:hypothetical protein [Chloroflexales bacterium]